MKASVPTREVEPRLWKLAPGWFSQRTHGTFEPCVGTILNSRPKFPRNRAVRLKGQVMKFKHTPFVHMPVPTTILNTRNFSA